MEFDPQLNFNFGTPDVSESVKPSPDHFLDLMRSELAGLLEIETDEEWEVRVELSSLTICSLKTETLRNCEEMRH